MDRASAVTVPLALLLGIGCALLESYPGGEDPGKALADAFDPKKSIMGGDPQEPLVDPAIDDTITVIANIRRVLAFPGEAFLIDLEFSAENSNVVGGGIQFPGSNEVQWTFIQGLEGMDRGAIQFAYVVDTNVCTEVPNLCHLLATNQFAVARNVTGDVDGDGVEDGDFVVSKPADVDVILQCATCESPSCQDVLEAGECSQCGQPAECRQYFEACLDPEVIPGVTQEDVDFFNSVFGPNGALWTSPNGCAAGEALCNGAYDDYVASGMTTCRLGGGGGDGGGTGTGG